MTDLLIAWQLVRRGGRARAVTIAAAHALAALALLLCAALLVSVPPGTGRVSSQWTALGVASLGLGLPVVSLLVAAARLAAGTRDRGLASLRLLGTSKRQTRSIAECEALLLAVSGAVGGALLALGPASWALSAADRSWWHGLDAPGLVVAPGPCAVVVCAVSLCALLSSPLGSWRARRDPLRVRRGARRVPPTGLLALPSLVGLAVLAYAAHRPPASDGDNLAEEQLTIVGGLLLGVGLMLVVPLILRIVGSALVGSSSPALLVAGRRLRHDSGSVTRLVAGLLIALFVVAIGRCLVTRTQTVEYQEAMQVAVSSRQVVTLRVRQPDAVDATEAARRLPGVVAAFPGYDAAFCLPGATVCDRALVGTCDDLTARHGTALGCSDGHASWLQSPASEDGRVTFVPADRLTSMFVSRRPAQRELPVLGTITWGSPPTSVSDLTSREPARLFVPRALVADLLPARPWMTEVVVTGGEHQVDEVKRALATLGSPESASDDLSVIRAEGLLLLLRTGSLAVVAVSLAALLLAGVDQAVSRRRHLAALHRVGVSRAVWMRSQLAQSLAPLVLGIPLACASGLAVGATTQEVLGGDGGTPWAAVSAIAGLALLGAVITAAITCIGLGRTVRAAELRTE